MTSKRENNRGRTARATSRLPGIGSVHSSRLDPGPSQDHSNPDVVASEGPSDVVVAFPSEGMGHRSRVATPPESQGAVQLAPELFPCPVATCPRSGPNGFTTKRGASIHVASAHRAQRDAQVLNAEKPGRGGRQWTPGELETMAVLEVQLRMRLEREQQEVGGTAPLQEKTINQELAKLMNGRTYDGIRKLRQPSHKRNADYSARLAEAAVRLRETAINRDNWGH